MFGDEMVIVTIHRGFRNAARRQNEEEVKEELEPLEEQVELDLIGARKPADL